MCARHGPLSIARPFAERTRAPAVQPELRRSPVPISLLRLGRGGDDSEGQGDQAGWCNSIPYAGKVCFSDFGTHTFVIFRLIPGIFGHAKIMLRYFRTSNIISNVIGCNFYV